MMTNEEIKLLAKAIVDEMDEKHSADYAPKWEGASLFFIPNDDSAKDHEIPVDRLMHKIIMVRDNLRVLEQQINSNESLSRAEKVKFQGYISKCYGSLTSFNFLFYNPEDKFSSK